jgi:ABC-type lipoprotein release transport system permease subunit
MLFRKKGTASTILAIALLIALLASVTSVINNLNSQTNTLSRLAGIGTTYLVMSQNSTALTDSKVDSSLVDVIRSISGVEAVLPQKLVEATLTAPSGSYTVLVRGVPDVRAFLNVKHAGVSGSVCVNESQANVGSILSNLASTKSNDLATLTLDDRMVQVKIVGIIQSKTQSDTEIVVPISTAYLLSGNNNTLSLIEFSLKDGSAENQVISQITQDLSPDYKVVKIQQLETFAQGINGQIASFLNLWSLAIYAVVVAASYVVATRLITEARYELGMFRTLGAKKRFTIELVLVNTVAVAFFGSLLGVAIGVAGAQVASTAVRWLWGNFQISPFLDCGQALQIILLALCSALIGCIYPAIKSVRDKTMESNL